MAAVSENNATLVLEDLESHPTPRLSFGHGPQEQLVSKHSMEIMSMDEELNNFRQSWQEKRSRMLERHQRERESGGMNGEGSSSLTAVQEPWFDNKPFSLVKYTLVDILPMRKLPNLKK